MLQVVPARRQKTFVVIASFFSLVQTSIFVPTVWQNMKPELLFVTENHKFLRVRGDSWIQLTNSAVTKPGESREQWLGRLASSYSREC